jgi:hypothetical protein
LRNSTSNSGRRRVSRRHEQFDRFIAQWLDLAKDLIATPAKDAHDIAAKLITLARLISETGDAEERDLDMLADIQRDMQRLAS